MGCKSVSHAKVMTNRKYLHKCVTTHKKKSSPGMRRLPFGFKEVPHAIHIGILNIVNVVMANGRVEKPHGGDCKGFRVRSFKCRLQNQVCLQTSLESAVRPIVRLVYDGV